MFTVGRNNTQTDLNQKALDFKLTCFDWFYTKLAQKQGEEVARLQCELSHGEPVIKGRGEIPCPPR